MEELDKILDSVEREISDSVQLTQDERDKIVGLVSRGGAKFDGDSLTRSKQRTWDKISVGMYSERVQRSKRRLFIRIGSVAAVLFIVASVSFTLGLFKSETVLITATNESTDGMQITLPDGSDVWLYKGATIEYPEKFPRGTRNLSLTGEAYFDVVSESRPFMVDAGALRVSVHGTRFNVFSGSDGMGRVILEEGSVSFSATGGEDREEIFIVPGQMATIDPSGGIIVAEVDVDLYTSWKDNYINFRSRSLEDVMFMLSRSYHVNIRIDSEELKKETLSGRFDKSEPLEQIFDNIGFMTPICYKYKEGTYVITPRR